MTEKKESQMSLVSPRETPVQDEVLEEYLIQIIATKSSIISYAASMPLEAIKELALAGRSVDTAFAIAMYEIPDEESRQILATAFERNGQYFRRQPTYFQMKEQLDSEIEWMQNAAKRLRGEEI